MNLIYGLLLLACAAMCTGASGSQPPSIAAEQELLSAMDWSALGSFAIDAPHTLHFNPVAAGPISSKRELTAPLESYNDAEKKLLGGWLTPQGQRASLVRTLAEIRQYEQEMLGRPASGMDIVQWRLAKTKGSQASAFANAPALQHYERLSALVNPATGQIFERFDSLEWHKYGVYIQPTDEPQDYMRTFNVAPEDFEEKAGRLLPELWRIVAFGDEPGEVLVDKCIGVERSTR